MVTIWAAAVTSGMPGLALGTYERQAILFAKTHISMSSWLMHAASIVCRTEAVVHTCRMDTDCIMVEIRTITAIGIIYFLVRKVGEVSNK